MASSNVNFKSSGNNFIIEFISLVLKPNVDINFLSPALHVNVVYAPTLATFVFPYLSCKCLNTASMSEKSASTSGVRPGVKNLSNNKFSSSGFTSCISNAYATLQPAPLPLPSETCMPFSLAHLMYSCTTRK